MNNVKEDLGRKGTFFIHHSSGIPIPLGEITLGGAHRIAREKAEKDPKLTLSEKGKGEISFRKILAGGDRGDNG